MMPPTPLLLRARRSRARAFTLVELAIVVAIIGVLAALAMPRFASASNRYRARLAADRVMRDIAHTRARALALGAQQSISFSSASINYTIVGMQNPDAPASTYTVSLTSDPYRCTQLTANFAGAGTLTFNGFGVPAAAGVVTVYAGGFSCTVTVAAGSGACTLGAIAAATPIPDGYLLARAD